MISELIKASGLPNTVRRQLEEAVKNRDRCDQLLCELFEVDVPGSAERVAHGLLYFHQMALERHFDKKHLRDVYELLDGKEPRDLRCIWDVAYGIALAQGRSNQEGRTFIERSTSRDNHALKAFRFRSALRFADGKEADVLFKDCSGTLSDNDLAEYNFCRGTIVPPGCFLSEIVDSIATSNHTGRFRRTEKELAIEVRALSYALHCALLKPKAQISARKALARPRSLLQVGVRSGHINGATRVFVSTLSRIDDVLRQWQGSQRDIDILIAAAKQRVLFANLSEELSLLAFLTRCLADQGEYALSLMFLGQYRELCLSVTDGLMDDTLGVVPMIKLCQMDPFRPDHHQNSSRKIAFQGAFPTYNDQEFLEVLIQSTIKTQLKDLKKRSAAWPWLLESETLRLVSGVPRAAFERLPVQPSLAESTARINVHTSHNEISCANTDGTSAAKFRKVQDAILTEALQILQPYSLANDPSELIHNWRERHGFDLKRQNDTPQSETHASLLTKDLCEGDTPVFDLNCVTSLQSIALEARQTQKDRLGQKLFEWVLKLDSLGYCINSYDSRRFQVCNDQLVLTDPTGIVRLNKQLPLSFLFANSLSKNGVEEVGQFWFAKDHQTAEVSSEYMRVLTRTLHYLMKEPSMRIEAHFAANLHDTMRKTLLVSPAPIPPELLDVTRRLISLLEFLGEMFRPSGDWAKAVHSIPASSTIVQKMGASISEDRRSVSHASGTA